MKVSYSWIKDFIPVTETVEDISVKLTQSGLEVEGVEEVESVPGGLKGIVIGEVLTCEKHPDADKLSCTTIDLGDGEATPIVCGAPNIAAGQKVVVATVGTTLYPKDGDSFKIKKAKIRGVVSIGMVCAEDELGLGQSHDGIIVLDTDLPNGTPAAEYYNVENDQVIEIGLTPNRADATSHYGVAREIKALTGLPLIEDEYELPEPTGTPSISIKIQNKEACKRYVGAEIKGVKVAESPDWLKNRLNAIGVAPINNIVDITNYILHDLGQPLHAFDSDKITSKKVVIRNVDEGTPFVTLDDEERKLFAEDLVICDTKEPMCLAGVFGGATSGVTDSTVNLFLEGAYFHPDPVRKSSLRHNLKTDSSFRFERGTDPKMPLKAVQKAIQLILELAGGELAAPITDVYPMPVPDFDVDINVNRVKNLIGLDLNDDQVQAILESLEIEIVAKLGEDWNLKVPSYRVDVTREADIAEEVLRIYGFDKVEINENLSASFLAKDNATLENRKTVVANYLAAEGLSEIYTNSLTKASYLENQDEVNASETVEVLNRLSEDLGVMRQTLLFSGLEVIAHNQNRKQKNVKVFEFGKTYSKNEEGYQEEQHLSMFFSGANQEESWLDEVKPVTFHDLSALVYTVLSKLKCEGWVTETVSDKTLTEGLVIKSRKGDVLAKFGAVHPLQLKKVGVSQDVFYADFNLDLVFNQKRKALVYKELSKFPEVRRDLSIVLKKEISFGEVKALTQKVDQKFIKQVNVFDVYEGDNVGEGNKSYSVAYLLQDKNQTLNDKVIDKVMNKLISAYETELGAVIRK